MISLRNDALLSVYVDKLDEAATETSKLLKRVDLLRRAEPESAEDKAQLDRYLQAAREQVGTTMKVTHFLEYAIYARALMSYPMFLITKL